MISKEEIEELKKVEGNVRGDVIKSNAVFIEKKEGKEGIKALEKKMAELGYPLNFDKINSEKWYPVPLSALVIVMTKDLFNWSEKDIFEMGNYVPKFSFLARHVLKYFLSLKRFAKEVPKYWRQHFDFGELEVSELNEEKRYLILRERGYKSHPLICIYHAGYYLGVARFIIKSRKIEIKEIKCVFKGDPYHEYLITW
jgi:hypothetical protein